MENFSKKNKNKKKNNIQKYIQKRGKKGNKVHPIQKVKSSSKQRLKK